MQMSVKSEACLIRKHLLRSSADRRPAGLYLMSLYLCFDQMHIGACGNVTQRFHQRCLLSVCYTPCILWKRLSHTCWGGSAPRCSAKLKCFYKTTDFCQLYANRSRSLEVGVKPPTKRLKGSGQVVICRSVSHLEGGQICCSSLKHLRGLNKNQSCNNNLKPRAMF